MHCDTFTNGTGTGYWKSAQNVSTGLDYLAKDARTCASSAVYITPCDYIATYMS